MIRSESVFDRPIKVDIFDHPLNAASVNPDLAEDGYYSPRPLIENGITENSFEIPDERDIYSPKSKNLSLEVEFNGPEVPAPQTTRTNPELAKLVAKLTELDEQKIDKVVIPYDAPKKVGGAGLQLLEAARSNSL